MYTNQEEVIMSNLSKQKMLEIPKSKYTIDEIRDAYEEVLKKVKLIEPRIWNQNTNNCLFLSQLSNDNEN